MRLITIKHVLLIVVAVFFINGCAATGKIEQLKPISADLANYKSVVVNVVSQVSGAEQERIQLENSLVDKLRQRGQFEEIMSGNTAPDMTKGLKLDGIITSLKKVDSSMRMMLGALAGQAHVVVGVELIDIPSNGEIGEIRVEGKSSGGSIFAGTTEQAIDLAAEKIVNGIFPE